MVDTQVGKSYKAEAIMLLITLIWGGTFVLIKESVAEISPYVFNSYRFGVAALLWLVFSYRFLTFSKDYIRHGVILGILYGAGFLLQSVGLQYTTVAKSGFITGSMVIITPFAYKIIEHKSVSLFAKIGVVCAGIGLWIFTDPSLENINIGDILTLLSAVVWAVYLVYIDVFTRDSIQSPLQRTATLVFMQFATTCAMSLAASLITRASFALPTGGTVLLALGYTSLLATVVATGLQTHWQKSTTPVKAALIFTLEPIFATALGVVVLSEHIGEREILGGFIILFGVLAAEVGGALLPRFSRNR